MCTYQTLTEEWEPAEKLPDSENQKLLDSFRCYQKPLDSYQNILDEQKPLQGCQNLPEHKQITTQYLKQLPDLVYVFNTWITYVFKTWFHKTLNTSLQTNLNPDFNYIFSSK